MNWKVSLDRYLTSEPEDGFSIWVDILYEKVLTNEFYRKYENSLYGKKVDIILSKLFERDYDVDTAGQIFMRLFRLYKLS